MRPFRIGINMAGAVSAGAYTAGVFDFLIQALHEWQKSKDNNDPAPRHEISIEVLSGASAGGMCSGLGALSLYDETQQRPESTRLYRAWVQEIDIADLLKTDDLEDGSPVLSVLDCTVLDRIATSKLRWQIAPQKPPYVSPNLRLYLSLTNLRGIPYSVDVANQGSFEEHIGYHADQIQFEVLPPRTERSSDLSYELPIADQQADGWRQLQAAALATGAFPIALRARNVPRTADEYAKKRWTVSNPGGEDDAGNCKCETTTTIPPSWDIATVKAPFDTVNVDGGVTNNNPFECARQYLVSLDKPSDGHLPRDARQANSAVMSIAPFPGDERFSNDYASGQKGTLFGIVPDLLSALLSQSRFQGENLSLLRDDKIFSRFVIAPDDNKVQPPVHALQCGSLGAFGGFLYQGFRNRDYQLGRRNCQRFLQEHFVLPAENQLMAAGLEGNNVALTEQFRARDSSVVRPKDIQTTAWMPIIPLCGTAKDRIEYPARVKIPAADLEKTISAAVDRLTAVVAQIAKGNGIFARLFGWEVRLAIKTKGRSWLKEKIVAELKKEQSI